MTYSGSQRDKPNAYFRQLPNLDYPSLSNDRSSVYDYETVKNIFKRAIIRNDIFDEVTAFTKYSVQGDERPDQVADTMYDDPTLDWVVLTTNNIIHVRDEWPMGNQDFLTYLNDKYTAEELANIHHYETEVVRDSNGKLIQLSGITVPEGHSVTFVDNGVLRTESKIKSFSFLEHETNLNDAKRNINILRPEYLNLFLEEFGDIMEYKPSRQFVNKNLKKTENPRIISP
jgi:hypothetical protein|tara:strand:+ start:430 stop:1116 length:687 start_codon:yes stop_codon:yes gene_type:complete